jgi:hypothetical protein
LFFDEVCEGFFDEGNFSSPADFDIHHAQVKATGLVIAKPSVTGVSRHPVRSQLLSLSSSLRAYIGQGASQDCLLAILILPVTAHVRQENRVFLSNMSLMSPKVYKTAV